MVELTDVLKRSPSQTGGSEEAGKSQESELICQSLELFLRRLNDVNKDPFA